MVTQATQPGEHMVTQATQPDAQLNPASLGESNLRRRRRNRAVVDSSSESGGDTSGPDDMETTHSHHEEEEEESEEEEGATAQYEAELPKDTWHPLLEITRRERGYPSRVYSDFMLRERTGASIDLVRKLTLHKKLEHHGGCVNSLHFNATGNHGHVMGALWWQQVTTASWGHYGGCTSFDTRLFLIFCGCLKMIIV